MKRRRFVTSAAVVAAVAAAAPVTRGLISGDAHANSESSAETSSTTTLETVAVRRGDLTSEREFKGVLGFGESWPLTTSTAGTITDQHPVGTIVGFGETLLRVDDRPLWLGRGAMPMYRELSEVDTGGRDEFGNKLKLSSGFDVAQLQSFLLEAGFDADGSLTVDGVFGAGTEKAVKAWQAAAGLPPSGRVDNSQLVFSAEPLRIASASRVGAPFDALEVSKAEPTVLVDTSNRDRSAFEVDAPVTVEVADSGEQTGKVDGQKQVDAADGSTVWRTTIVVPAALGGQATTATASATVTATELVAENVLIVPVGALVAVAEGGFAVEVPTGTSSALVGVEAGVVLDAQAEVAGNLAVGDLVVVPT